MGKGKGGARINRDGRSTTPVYDAYTGRRINRGGDAEEGDREGEDGERAYVSVVVPRARGQLDALRPGGSASAANG